MTSLLRTSVQQFRWQPNHIWHSGPTWSSYLKQIYWGWDVYHFIGTHVLVHRANANSLQRKLAGNAFATLNRAHLCNSNATRWEFKTPLDAHHTKAARCQASIKACIAVTACVG
jgi:hypothetical protein